MDLGTALNIASLGFEVCKEFLEYYRQWKECAPDIDHTCVVVEQVGALFACIRETVSCERSQLTTNQAWLIEKSLASCWDGVDSLSSELIKLKLQPRPKRWPEKSAYELRRALYPLRAGNLRRATSTLKELRLILNDVVTALNLDAGLRSRQLLHSVSSQIANTSSRIGDIKDLADDVWKVAQCLPSKHALLEVRLDELETRLLQDRLQQWLEAASPHGIQENSRRRCVPGTGQWLLQDPRYAAWKTMQIESSKLLWLTEKPGCGKTALASTVIEDLQFFQTLPSGPKVLYFFFTFSDATMQNFADLLRSLIQQLIENTTIDSCLRREIDRYTVRRPTDSTLQELFASLTTRCGPCFIVLDALDECSNATGPSHGSQRELVLRWLEGLVSCESGLRILFTSRPEPAIEAIMTSCGAEQIGFGVADVKSDIQRYLRVQIEQDYKLRALSEDLKDEIRSTILRKSDGMFLLAACQIEQIRNVRTRCPRNIRAALRDLHPTLHATFDRLLAQIPENEVHEARTALTWICSAVNPMTIQEVGEACVMDAFADSVVNEDNRAPLESILDLLGCLVVVDRDEELPFKHWPVRLIHGTLREYLISDKAPVRFRIHPMEAFVQITCDSLEYLWRYCQKLEDGHDCASACDCMPLVSCGDMQWMSVRFGTDFLELGLSLPSMKGSHTVNENLSRHKSHRGDLSQMRPLSDWVSMLSTKRFEKCKCFWTEHEKCSFCISLRVVLFQLCLMEPVAARECLQTEDFWHAQCDADLKQFVQGLLATAEEHLGVDAKLPNGDQLVGISRGVHKYMELEKTQRLDRVDALLETILAREKERAELKEERDRQKAKLAALQETAVKFLEESAGHIVMAPTEAALTGQFGMSVEHQTSIQLVW